MIEGIRMTRTDPLPTKAATAISTTSPSESLFRTARAWVFVVVFPLVGMILCSIIAERARAAGSSTKHMDAGMLSAAVIMVIQILVVVTAGMNLLM